MFTTKDNTSCVLTNNGNLYIWGFDIYNVKCRFNRAPRTPKLMNPHRFQDYSGVINKVTLKEEEKLVAIDAGVEFLGAITESGRVFMWGCNSEGQLGNGSIIAAFTPTLIPQSYFNNEKIILLYKVRWFSQPFFFHIQQQIGTCLLDIICLKRLIPILYQKTYKSPLLLTHELVTHE